MLFNSLVFLFVFLPVTYLAFWRLRGRTARWAFLTVASYIFYGAWDYRFCALMAFTTLVSYSAGIAMSRTDDKSRQRFVVVAAVAVDLAVLGIFKYLNFALGSAGALATTFGISFSPPFLQIILPLGISFYTFHTISYIVDAYRGVIQPTRNLFEFTCYVSLFSQLVAGPIVRFLQIEDDLAAIDTAERRRDLERGWSFFVIGLAEKVLIADTIAAVIDPALARYTELSTHGAWLCMVGYSYQLLFDFAGYSNMAVGLGYLFGIRIPQNFNSPYKATSPADFWRRWHMSLSSFLKDYLYIPLGGGRGSRLSVVRNLMITMLLGGLWHGASWTFVAWGGYHGLLLAADRSLRGSLARIPLVVTAAVTFVLVVIGWVFFRSDSLEMASELLTRMFIWTPGVALQLPLGFVAAMAAAAYFAHVGRNAFEISHQWRPAQVVALSSAFAASLAFIVAGQFSPFLYFQF